MADDCEPVRSHGKNCDCTPSDRNALERSGSKWSDFSQEHFNRAPVAQQCLYQSCRLSKETLTAEVVGILYDVKSSPKPYRMNCKTEILIVQ